MAQHPIEQRAARRLAKLIRPDLADPLAEMPQDDVTRAYAWTREIIDSALRPAPELIAAVEAAIAEYDALEAHEKVRGVLASKIIGKLRHASLPSERVEVGP